MIEGEHYFQLNETPNTSVKTDHEKYAVVIIYMLENSNLPTLVPHLQQ